MADSVVHINTRTEKLRGIRAAFSLFFHGDNFSVKNWLNSAKALVTLSTPGRTQPPYTDLTKYYKCIYSTRFSQWAKHINNNMNDTAFTYYFVPLWSGQTSATKLAHTHSYSNSRYESCQLPVYLFVFSDQRPRQQLSMPTSKRNRPLFYVFFFIMIWFSLKQWNENVKELQNMCM